MSQTTVAVFDAASAHLVLIAKLFCARERHLDIEAQQPIHALAKPHEHILSKLAVALWTADQRRGQLDLVDARDRLRDLVELLDALVALAPR